MSLDEVAKFKEDPRAQLALWAIRVLVIPIALAAVYWNATTLTSHGTTLAYIESTIADLKAGQERIENAVNGQITNLDKSVSDLTREVSALKQAATDEQHRQDELDRDNPRGPKGK